MTDLVIIDADSILYTVGWVEPSPAKGRASVKASIKKIMEDTEAETAMVFVKGSNNFRFQVDIEYKAHRGIDPDKKKRVDLLYEFAREEYTVCDDAEADDYCGIYATKATAEGKSVVIAHMDKDLDMLPGYHYNFRKKESYQTSVEESYRFLMQQLLTGDAADNIKGIHRLGPVTAKKILDPVPVHLLYPTVINTWKTKQPEDWQNNFWKCANCIFIRTDEADLRPLTMDELNERFSWSTDLRSLDLLQEIQP